ncbi:MAG TPA: hypothetical protein GX521_08745 [Firmicutes bacterium]|nr:hypothetical protein [Bacillota bacterium]
MSFRVGIIGLPVVDQVAHIPQFPQRGGHVSGTGLTLTPGGPAVNYATAIARLGGEACLIGPVGGDAFGQLIITELGKEGRHRQRARSGTPHRLAWRLRSRN